MIKMIGFVILLAGTSCLKKQENYIPPPVSNPIPVFPAAFDTTYTYLALGDSYTIGESVAVNDRFPVQTASLLLNDTVKIASPEIIARTGWTTGELLNEIGAKPPLKAAYDVVSLLIGVNNQYRRLSQDQYRLEFTTLLNKAIGYANNKKSRVFVLSIPDYGVTPFAIGSNASMIANEIDAFNAINKQITLSAGCTYIDITPISREAKSDPSLIASDGLHPSAKQYKRWAMLLSPQIKSAIR